MLGWLVRKKIAAFEKEFGYNATYMCEMYEASPRAFWKFSKITGMSELREDIPSEAWYAAKIVATLSEDCGPCTQLVVTMAERAEVGAPVLRAILAGDTGAMPADAALGFDFAHAVLQRDTAGIDRLRTEIIARWGRKAAVSLAIAIASSRVYPVVKYALGHGHTCMRVQVGSQDIPMVAGKAAASGN